jgi:hypothetical protein
LSDWAFPATSRTNVQVPLARQVRNVVVMGQ